MTTGITPYERRDRTYDFLGPVSNTIMTDESQADGADDADGLEAAEEAIDDEPDPGLGPGADDGSEPNPGSDGAGSEDDSDDG